jgi:excisionase family DNA binding protein
MVQSIESLSSADTFNFAHERRSRKEAADYMGVSVEFLEVDVTNKRHKIPYIKVGTKVFYLKSDLDAWLLSNKVGA